MATSTGAYSAKDTAVEEPSGAYSPNDRPADAKPASTARRAADTGLALGRGIVAIPEAAVGVADIVTGGRAGKAVERLGVRFKDAKQVLTDAQSDEQKAADAQVQQADGFLPTLGAMVRNPSTIVNAAAESVPSMLAGGALSRGLVNRGLGAITAGAAGEAAVSAGSSAEQVRQESPTGFLTPKQAALAATSGAATGIINRASGQLADKLGISDVNTALATGKLGGATEKGVARRVAEGAVNEGVLQELPQSAQEQAMQNIALDRPVGEGVAQAAASGMLVGGLTGAGFGAVSGGPEKATTTTEDPSLGRVQPPRVPPGVIPSEAGGGNAAAVSPPAAPPPAPPAPPAAPAPSRAQAMGINPTAGPLQAAAGVTVDTGADLVTQQQEVDRQRAEAQSKEKAKPGEDGKTPEPQAPAPVQPATPDPTAPVTGPFTQAIHGGAASNVTPPTAPVADPQGAAAAIQPVAGSAADAPAAPGVGADQGPQGAGPVPAALPEPVTEVPPVTQPPTQESTNASTAEVIDPETGEITRPGPQGEGGDGVQRPADAVQPGADAEGTQRAADEPAAPASAGAPPEGGTAAPVEPSEKDRRLKVVADTSRLSPEGGTRVGGLINGQVSYLGDPDRTMDGRKLMMAVDAALRAGATPQEVVDAATKPAPATPKPLPAEVEAKADEVMRAIGQIGGPIAITREQVVSLINARGIEAADKTIKGILDTIKRNNEAASASARAPKPPTPATPVDMGAHTAATSPLNDRPEPTQAQKEAGNYKKAHLVMNGLEISIKNPEGSTRSGVDADGKPWSNTMTGHYGYIKRTTGSDGEQQDVYVKPGTPLDYAGPVFVIDQIDPKTGKHDEFKSMVGYKSPMEARKAYMSNYAKDWAGLKSIKTMTWDEFKAWLGGEAGKKPLPRKGKQADGGTVRGMDYTGRPIDGKPVNAGDIFATSSGRQTTPYPSSKRQQAASQWLIDNAIAEATSRDDTMNAAVFGNEKPMKDGSLPPASQDSMLEYLFGQQPAVPKSILKPLAPASNAGGAAATQEQAAADKEPTSKAPAKPTGGKNLRGAAYERNPLLTFLAKHGLFHDKDKPGSQKSEFSPDRQVMVMGYGPVFRKNGRQLDELLPLAIQDGYLPPGSDEADLANLIASAIRGNRVAPMFTDDGAEKAAALRDQQDREDYERKQAEVFADLDRQASEELEGALADLTDAEFSTLRAELLDGPVADIDAESNTDVRSAMKALGFTDQEIDDATAQGQGAPGQDGAGRSGPAEAAGQGQGEGAQQGVDATAEGSQDDEGLTSPTRDDVIAQQDRAENAQALDDKAQIDREAEGFQLQAQTVDTRTDTTGDMFGGPSVDDYQQDMARRRKPGTEPQGPSLFDQPAEPDPGPQAAITPEQAANLTRGTIVKDGKGVEYYAWSARFDRLDVMPMKDGKPEVFAGNAIRFALTDAARSANPEYRTDPLYVVSMPTEAPTAAAPANRFEAGQALTKEQRKAVLASLVDVYKAKGAPREQKGIGADGNERYGYVHSPELFEKSDITGAMVRYYVTLPDGRIAHPSELFPNYTQADIDAAMAKNAADERNDADSQRRVEANAEQFSKPSAAEADADWVRRNPGPNALVDWRTNKRYSLVPMTKDGKFYSVRDDDTALMKRLERAGWVRADAAGNQAEPAAQATAILDAANVTDSDPQDRNGLRAEDRRLRAIDAAAEELAGQLANDMLDGQYATPSDRADIAKGLKLVADDAKVPVDDLREAVLKRIKADERLSKRQTKQIVDALNPTKTPPAEAKAELPGAQKPTEVTPPAWHTAIPDQGTKVVPADEKNYSQIPHRVATEAVEAVTQTQSMGNMALYAYVLPATDGHHGAARLFPDDQTPPAPWSLLFPEAMRMGMLTKEQAVEKLASALRRAPILGTMATAQPEKPRLDAAPPPTAADQTAIPFANRSVDWLRTNGGETIKVSEALAALVEKQRRITDDRENWTPRDAKGHPLNGVDLYTKDAKTKLDAIGWAINNLVAHKKQHGDEPLQKETPKATTGETEPLSKTIEKANAKHGAGLGPADAVSVLQAFKATMRAVYDGTASIEDYKTVYRRVRDAVTVKAELSKLTKDELIRTFGIMARTDEKKDSLVATAYKAMLRGFALGKSFGPSGYLMTRGGLEAFERQQAEALDAIVENHTAEDLAAYAAQVKSEREQKEAQRAARAEALMDPKTLEDFRALMDSRMREGKSFDEARMMLTPAQRALMDDLSASLTRGRRKVTTDDQRTQVRVAGQTVDGNIIATKHTKKGHDLYVVQLAERVSREDYETLNAGAKKIGGYYSSFRGGGAIPGFQFTTREQAQAFVTLAGGDATAAKEAAQTRRDAYADDRSQTAAERLTEMADAIDEAADESLGRERKANTARRARFAAAAEQGAREAKAMAKTMRNVAQALTSGAARFLDRVRTKTQVELLQTYVANAHGQELRAKYPSYAEQEKRKGQPPTQETADYAEFPTFTAFRSDLASLGRQLQEVDGTKKLGDQLMKVADDVSDAFTAWVKEPGNFIRVATFSGRDTSQRAGFQSKDAAERAIARSGYRGKAIPWSIKRGEWTVIMSPSEAIARGLWTGDGDKRITLSAEFGAELVEKMGRASRRGAKVSVPWQFERAYERRKQLEKIGLETPAEFRAALREFIGLREQAAEADRIKMLERAMVGKTKDGLDFFPTPESVADEMIAAADIKPDMAVLEPSAGMGHIADRIRAAGAEPDVIELAGDRRELLQEKGYHLAHVSDFLDLKPREFYTFGDVFKAPDGTEGVMHGGRGWSNRVSLHELNADGTEGTMLGWFDRDELTGVRHRGSDSGYDRIVMNPPFSDGRDIEHVRHAYSLLKPGGRLVALMGESAFTNQNKRATEFRSWLEAVGGTEEKLPEGSFMDPSLPVNTGANARMVVIEKAKDDASTVDSPAFARGNPFYSALTAELSMVNAAAQPALGWANTINGLVKAGKVKQDEVNWSGVLDWLKLQQGKITREQVVQFLDANGVRVEEMVLSDAPTGKARDRDILREAGIVIEVNPEDPGMIAFSDAENPGDFMDASELEAAGYPERVVSVARRIENAGRNRTDNAKYGQYQLPGGTNYREVLLTLPAKPVQAQATSAQRAYFDFVDRMQGEYGDQWRSKAPIDDRLRAAELERAARQSAPRDAANPDGIASARQDRANFRSTHWDQPNILAHIRVNDRTDADGKRVLFVEEIQSDWGQQGKKQGFKPGAAGQRRFQELGAEWDSLARIALGPSLTEDAIKAREQARQRQAQISDEMNAISDAERDGLPGGPFVTKTDAWLSLALKRIVKMAVDEGYDRVAFINGDQSAERYDLSKQIKAVRYTRDFETGKYDISFQPVNANGFEGAGQFDVDKLPDVVGKDLAKKIVEQAEAASQRRPDADVSGRFDGLDLKVGGEGMKAFYDKIVPNTLKDVLRKVGGGVLETVDLGRADRARRHDLIRERRELAMDDPRRAELDGEIDRLGRMESGAMKPMQQPGFTITPAMQERAADGLPLFDRSTGALRAVLQSMTGQGMTVEQVQAIVQPMAAKWDVDVRVVERPADLPIKAPSDAMGLHYNGVIYIVARTNRIQAQVLRTLAHETIAHYGLRSMLGRENWRAFMRQIQFAARRKGGPLQEISDYIRRTYVDENGKFNLSETQEGDEIAARVVELGVDPTTGEFRPGFGMLKAVFSKVAEFLRSLGFMIEFTNAELQGMLVRSQRALSRRAGRQSAMAGAAAARQGDVATTGGAVSGQSDALASLGRTMRGAGWEIEYIDLDLTGEKPTAGIRITRSDGRFLVAKVDSVGRASIETFQREKGLRMDPSTRGRRPLSPMVDDVFLGRQRFDGARSMMRGMVNYLVDNATEPVALADMRAAWAKVMAEPVRQDAIEDGSAARQGDQTQTAAFKAWFKDSKVVDADGKPLVVYHGTGQAMSGGAFDRNLAMSEGGGFYFSHSPLMKNPATNANDYAANRSGDSANVMPVYLRMSNPLVVGFTEPMPEGDKAIGAWLERMQKFNRSIDMTKERYYRNAIREAKAGSHDGVIVRNVEDVANDAGRRFVDEADVYIAFDPTQIKSATGNRGTFDPENPDISLARGARSDVNRMTAEQMQAEIKDLIPRVEQAYEDGNQPLAERLDARLETLMENLEANYLETEEDRLTAVDMLNPMSAARVADGEQGDTEADLVRDLANTWKEMSTGFGWGNQNLSDAEKAAQLRGMVDDYAYRHGGIKPGVTDQQILDAAEDAFQSVYGMRAQQLERIRQRNRPPLTEYRPDDPTPEQLAAQYQAMAAAGDASLAALRERQALAGNAENDQTPIPDWMRTAQFRRGPDLAAASRRASNTAAHYRSLGLQALGRRQITELYGNILHQLHTYNRLMAQMDADKNEVGAQADQIAKDWGNLKDERELAELMHDATLAQMDPEKPLMRGDDPFTYDGLRAKFVALSPEARQVYVQAREAYREHHENVRQAIRDRIERSELRGQRKAELLQQMDSEFYKAIKGVYFPLARFGDYVVIVRDPTGKVLSVNRAETLNEAEALQASLRQSYPGMTVGKVLKSKEFNAGRDAVGRGFMQNLYEALGRADMDDMQRGELEDMLGQLYLSALPDLSWAKHGIHRKGTPGFSQDARRAFAQNTFHGARYLAKVRYSDLLENELIDAQKQVDALADSDSYDSVKAQQVIDEMVKRHDAAMNPNGNALSTALTSVGFVFHLGLSPASAMVNLTQTALVALPLMGSKWGFSKSTAALLKASQQAASNGNDISKALSTEERRAFDEAVRSGVIDVTMAHDLAGISQGEDAKVAWKMRPVMRWASFLFHHAEKFNRQVTFVAAYRLAREAGTNAKQAYEQAVKATYDGHFDYSASNRPRIMQGNVAKVVLLFKQYGQNMVYTLSRQAYLAMKGRNPYERAQARRALGGLLAMHGAAAGVLGLPMVSTLLAAASFLGGDDDEPWDAEVALRNMLADALGDQAADVLARGLSRLTPWDISGRVGLDKLILPDIQEGLEGQDLANSAMAAALGPVAGIAVSAARGMQEIASGNWARGLEAMAPSLARGPLKALRYGTEGAIDKTGKPIVEDVGAAGVIGQALGFSPSEVRLATEAKSAVHQADARLAKRRADLMRHYAMAVIQGDQEGAQDALADIRAFNEKNPGRRINPLQMAKSVAMRRKQIAQSEGGVYLPRSRRDAMQAGEFGMP